MAHLLLNVHESAIFGASRLVTYMS